MVQIVLSLWNGIRYQVNITYMKIYYMHVIKPISVPFQGTNLPFLTSVHWKLILVTGLDIIMSWEAVLPLDLDVTLSLIAFLIFGGMELFCFSVYPLAIPIVYSRILIENDFSLVCVHINTLKIKCGKISLLNTFRTLFKSDASKDVVSCPCSFCTNTTWTE